MGPFLQLQEQTLSLQDYMQRVVEFNEAVQGEILSFHAARRKRAAEMGQFEPNFVTSADWLDRRYPMGTKAERDQAFVQAAVDAAVKGDPPPSRYQFPYVLQENNWTYSSAVEVMTPLGTKVRVGANAYEILNNRPKSSLSTADPDRPSSVTTGFTTSIGVTVEQPLLKGIGLAANLATLRLASRQSEIAFQEYRRQLMQVVAEAELAYWQLYYAQQELELTRDSVRVAQTLLDDSRASLESGRGAKLDVLEAEAGLAMRRSREREAFLKRVEAMNKLAAYFGSVPRQEQVAYVASDAPVSRPVQVDFSMGIGTALRMNPDFLRNQLQKEQERIRLGYAKNQRLPELNLKASFLAAGYGNEWDESFDDVDDYGFPAWSVGLVFRIPMGGDVRGRNEVRASRLRLMAAERTESTLVTQLRVGIDTATERIQANYTTARSQEAVVDFRVNLLDTRMQSHNVGRMDARSVLEAEQELLASRLEHLQSEIDYQRALLELQLLSGSILALRGLEATLPELEARTSSWTTSLERQTPAIKYTVADYTRLPAEEPMKFDENLPLPPWLGVDWKDSGFTNPEDENSDKNHPRRFDGSHIR